MVLAVLGGPAMTTGASEPSLSGEGGRIEGCSLSGPLPGTMSKSLSHYDAQMTSF
jgi:hypothetical protein